MIIQDKALAPYIIKLESSAYQIYKTGTRKSTVEGVTTEKDSIRFVASCKDLVSACYYIATLQMEKKKGVTVSLSDFLKEVRSIKTEMIKITHDNLEERLLKLESRKEVQKKTYTQTSFVMQDGEVSERTTELEF